MSMINALANQTGQATVNNINEAMAMAAQTGGGPEFAQTLASYLNDQTEEQILTKSGKSLQVMVTKSRREETLKNGRSVTVPCYGFKASMAFKQADGSPRIVQLEVTNGSSLWDILAPVATKECKLNNFTAQNKEVAKAVSARLHDILENGHDGTELSIGVSVGQNGNNAGQVRNRLFLQGIVVIDEADEWDM